MTQTEFRTDRAAEIAGDTAVGCACEGGCGSARSTVSRRTAIGVGVLAGAALVTACGSSDGGTASSSTTSSSTPSSSAASSSATSASTSASSSASSSATSESSSTAGSSSSAAGTPAGALVAKVADVPAGGSLVVASGGQQIALAKNADGSIVAHTAICTHQGCTVEADGATLACPCHRSTFDAFTGEVTKSPANKPLAEIKVEVSGDGVYLTA